MKYIQTLTEKGKLKWHNSDAPEADGKFRDLSPKDLAAWLIKTRKSDMKKISGSLSQQVAFNKSDDPEYAKKMDKTRKEVYKQLDREDLLESVLNEEDTWNDYPAAAKKNAQKAIDWKEEHGRDEVDAGTPVGWARAHQLAKGENLSTDTVKRMSAFNRHRKNSSIKPELKATPWKDRGYVAWLIWGGDEGVDWAIEKSKEIDAMKESNQLKYIKPLNEAEKYITDEFKVGDKIKTNFGEWEVIETDYAPNKSFTAPFIFKGKDMERVNIPNPPKTNKNAVGYKVTDGDKYPIIGFLYQYKDITKLATVGVDESVVNEEKIKYVKGKTYQSSGHWTVYVDSNSSGFDIRVNHSAGWRLDPHDEKEETLELLDNGRQRATIYFKSGNIDKFAQKMFDLNDRTSSGNQTKLTAKDYADIIRVWIDMKMANESIVAEGMSKSAIKKAIKVIDKQIDTETGGDGEALDNETLQALEQERERLLSMNESKDRMIKQIERALKDNTSIFKLPMAAQDYYRKNKSDFISEAKSNFETLLGTSEDESIGRKIRLGGKRDPGQEVWQKVDKKNWMNLKTKKKLDLNKWARHADEFHMADKDLQFESKVNEASRRKVHKAAKQGSYPAVIVVVQDGKVIHQEPVSTPDVAPATFNVMQEKYPKAVLHLEDNTGKRLFTENMKRLKSFDNFVAEKKSLINEAKAYKLKASEFGADTHSAAYNVKGETTWRVHSTYAIDQVSGENNPEERDVVFFEAMPINNDIYIKIGGINNLKRTNGATVGNNFGTTIEEWKNNPRGIAKEASDFLTDATHLKWINKKARSEGQVIKWALKDDYSSVIEDLVNKSLGLSEGIYAKQSKIQPGDYIQTQYGYFYKRVEGQVGGQDAYVEIKKGKEGKKKTSIHDTVDFDIVDKSIALDESQVTEKREDVGKYNTVKKVIAKIGRRPSEQELATFITKNYYDVTEVERGDDDPAANDKIADLVAFYKYDIDDWNIAWVDAQNESAKTFKYIKPLNEYYGKREHDDFEKEFGKIKYPKWIKVKMKELVDGQFIDKLYAKPYNYMSLWLNQMGKRKFNTDDRKKELGEVGYKLTDRYWHDLTGHTAFKLEAAEAAMEVSKHIQDMVANKEEVEPSYYLMKNYFNTFGMQTDRSRIFNMAVEILDEWMTANAIETL